MKLKVHFICKLRNFKLEFITTLESSNYMKYIIFRIFFFRFSENFQIILKENLWGIVIVYAFNVSIVFNIFYTFKFFYEMWKQNEKIIYFENFKKPNIL